MTRKDAETARRVREAEAHGMIAGALAAGEDAGVAARLAAAMAGGENTGPALAGAADECLRRLRAGRFVLPTALLDSALPLAARAELLSGFTRGFLSGLGQAGERLAALDADGTGMLRDLEVIGRGIASVAEAEADARSESAYRELAEYLRLAPGYFYRVLAGG